MPIIWKKSAKILTFTTLILLIALLFVTACGVKVPEKYKRKWAKDTKFDGTCYKTMQMSGDELKILQLTDIHFDDHNNRKEWTLDLISNVIERANPDLISVTGDWVSTNEKKERDKATKDVFDVIDSYNIPWIVAFGNYAMSKCKLCIKTFIIIKKISIKITLLSFAMWFFCYSKKLAIDID